MALAALELSEAPAHEPVHRRRQTISVIVTQRSGRDFSTTTAHLTIWLGRSRTTSANEAYFALPN
jgi:endonuclease/exonuclease/phosphatase family metal-dependent hydrolase